MSRVTHEVHSSGLLTRLGLFTAVLVVMSSMIGSGIFKKAVPMAGEVQSGGILLVCWLIAGLITLMGALINAEVAGLIAAPGGQYIYFKEMYGKAFAFIYGWSCFSVIQSASIASIAYVFAESVNAILPLPNLLSQYADVEVFGIFYPFQSSGVKLLTIATIIFLTSANYLGVIFGGYINNFFTVLKTAGILAIIILGLILSQGTVENIYPVLENPNAEYGSSLGLFGAMFAAMLGAFWAYDGWNNIGYLGGEVKNPKRSIPIALGVGVGIVIIVYMLTNFVYLYVLSVEDIQRLADVENSIVGVEVMRSILGNTGVFFISVLIMISTFGTTNGTILASSRIYFAMSRDKLFFRSAGKVHPRFKTPYTSLLIQGAWACLLVLSGTFDQLTDMLIFASFIFYGAGAFGVFVLRKKMKEHHRPYKVTGYPVVPVIFVLFCITLVLVTIFQNPRDAGIGLLLVFSGIPFYLYWNRKK